MSDMRLSYREGISESEHIFENHCHERYEMIAVLDGSISIVMEDGRYELSAGMVAIIPPLKYHSVFAEAGSMYNRITLLFDASFIPPAIFSDFSNKISHTPIVGGTGLMTPLAGIRGAIAEDDGEKMLPLIRCYLTELIYIHTYRTAEPAIRSAKPRIGDIISYIDGHLSDSITLDDIASYTFLSKSTVCHLFKEEMKISVKQYILQKKLNYAARLISDGCSAGEAARRIGYDNYANFYKMYLKVFSKTPKTLKPENK